MIPLKLGSKGNEVKNLQTTLNYLGYLDNRNARLSEDGSFGHRTEEAVNRFKDNVLPGGNKGENRGIVGATTMEFLESAEPVMNPAISRWIPSIEYAKPGSWADKEIEDFIAFEGGLKLTWDGCTPRLLKAKEAFEKELAARGWSIRYTSAYRSYMYQSHFHDVWAGPASKTPEGKAHCKQHGIRSASDPRRGVSTHIMGVAFDCRVSDGTGRVLNPDGKLDSELIKVAALCGFKPPPLNDTVHFEIGAQ